MPPFCENGLQPDLGDHVLTLRSPRSTVGPRSDNDTPPSWPSGPWWDRSGVATIGRIRAGTTQPLCAGGASADDRAIAARLAAGEADALGAIYRAHGGMVFGICQRVLQNRALAEDVTQDVFTFLWEHPERFDPSLGTLRAWLGLLAHRRSVDRVRSESRRARNEARGDRCDGVESSADDCIAAAWMSSRVRAALDQLPAEQREVVVLAYYGDRTYLQVAEELDLPEGTVKSRVRLALKKLNALLRPELNSEDVPTWT